MVEHISDTVGVMYLGNLVEYGATEDIFRNPLHPYTKALFSAIPIPDPDGEDEPYRAGGQHPVSRPTRPRAASSTPAAPTAWRCCKEEAPVQRELEPGHFVACHLYDK